MEAVTEPRDAQSCTGRGDCGIVFIVWCSVTADSIR